MAQTYILPDLVELLILQLNLIYIRNEYQFKLTYCLQSLHFCFKIKYYNLLKEVVCFKMLQPH